MIDLKKIYYLLTIEERKKLIRLLMLTTIMAFLDAAGVASIVPFMSVIANPDVLSNNFYLASIYKKLKFSNVNEFLLILGFSVFSLTLLSIVLKAFTHYLQLHFSLFCEFNISKRLVCGYLNQPYEWFLNNNSADLGRKIVSEVNLVVFNALLPTMAIFTQGMLVIALLSLLIYTAPTLALVTGATLVGSYGIIYACQRKALVKYGTDSNKANADRFIVISEAFGAIKDIKVGMHENVYLDEFSRSSRKFAKNQATFQVTTQMPRYALELISIGGILAIMLFLINAENAFSDILPIVALYAFAGYRIMPSLQQVYHSLSQVKFAKPSIDILHADMTKLKCLRSFDKPTVSMKFLDSILLSNIRFSYSGVDKPALNRINMHIKARSSVGIIGSTGSGKSTLVDIILGLLEPESGSISVDGNLICQSNVRLWQNAIGYVPQQIYLSDDSLAANIAFGIPREKIDYSQIEKVSKIACLYDFIKELSAGYETIIGERGVRLSGGQRQRIGIARALYHNPQVLILDEATSSLDGITENLVMNAINALGSEITIIIVAHRLSTVRNCNNIYILEKSEMIDCGSFEDLKSRNEYFNRLLESTT